MKKKYKIQGAGSNQLRITIPIIWARHHKLDKGDEIWVEFSDDPVLTIYPVDREPEDKEQS